MRLLEHGKAQVAVYPKIASKFPSPGSCSTYKLKSGAMLYGLHTLAFFPLFRWYQASLFEETFLYVRLSSYPTWEVISLEGRISFSSNRLGTATEIGEITHAKMAHSTSSLAHVPLPLQPSTLYLSLSYRAIGATRVPWHRLPSRSQQPLLAQGRAGNRQPMERKGMDHGKKNSRDRRYRSFG